MGPFAQHRDPASRSPHWAPGATPTPVPPALPRPRRLLAWASMATARGAGGVRVSKRIPEAPWRETKVTNEIEKSNDKWGVRTWSIG